MEETPHLDFLLFRGGFTIVEAIANDLLDSDVILKQFAYH